MYNNQKYNNYNKPGYNSYAPKKPVKTFQDLEIYQLALAASVAVAGIALTKDKKKTEKIKAEAENLIIHNLLPCALGLPHLIAEAHSFRFGTGTECLALLEKVMVNCNKLAVYLEQTRDICPAGHEPDFFEELIKKYSYIRRKTLNLQRVWKKYIEHPNADFAPGPMKIRSL
ncbi:MAG: hypothetical protein Q8O93_00305 [bacterium]|nr:hypothetical protein [bacterium]